jgi:hypothetical protein
MNIRDQLVHTTVRIETRGPHGQGSGTGFFMNFCVKENSHVSTIVTNKHVIAGVADGKISVTAKKRDSGEPDLGNLIAVPVTNFAAQWIFHPDPLVDVAVFPISPLLSFLSERQQEAFYMAFDNNIVADALFLENLSAIEDIIMIGYPIGLWDSKHNFPIVRRGITATPLYIDFNGKSEFVIDCACFPGSSGSPILLYNDGGYMNKEGGIIVGPSRINLIGILYAGRQHTTTGEIKVIPIPTSVQPVAISGIPSNLGYCIKAHNLQYFEKHFQALAAAKNSRPPRVEIGLADYTSNRTPCARGSLAE